jgi:DNA-binding CsgD family transcriptional regulator
MEEALALARETGHRVLIYLALFWRAEVARSQGSFERAVKLLEESLALMQVQGDRLTTAWALASLGQVALLQGEATRAEALYRESLILRADLADRYSIALSLEALAWAAGAQRQVERTAHLLGAAERLRESVGATQEPQWQTDHERAVAAARAGLGEERCVAARAAGHDLPLDQAIAYAQATLEPASARGATSAKRVTGRHPSQLTRREQEVAVLIARGLTNRQIADAMSIAERTAASHIENILGKLGFRSRAQVAAWAVERRLTEGSDGLKPSTS